jgi:phage gp45-like
MHRASPLNSSFRGYVSGGSRATIDKSDDDKMMQETSGNFMKGESRDKVEAPQNYGFTSVNLPAKKGQNGEIEESAEAFIGFQGGNRSFPVAYVIDDRRHRPMGLKAGENAQYDDIGQMTLMRRNGLFLLTLDSEDDSQQSGGASAGTQATGGAAGGQGKKVERMVSLRHVEKKKQERKKQQQGGGADAGQQALGPSVEPMATQGQQGSQSKEHKHEGETVNTEVRCTKNRIEFRTGDKVVGYYDVKEDKWFFTGKDIHNKASGSIKDEAPKIEHNG